MRRWWVPIRISISLILLGILIWWADPARIWAIWQNVDFGLLVWVLLLQFGGIVLSAAKWSLLLQAGQQRLPFRFLLANYLVGQFANNFLPTTIGGDALRVVQLGRKIASYSQASASVFLERLTGFLALSLIACVALIVSLLPGTTFVSQPWVQWVTAGFTVLALVALVASFLAHHLDRWFGGWLPARFRTALTSVASALSDYAPRGWMFVIVMLFSFAFQLLWVGIHALCGMALGIQVPSLLYALMVPLTDILGLIPLFFNNLGVREAVFILYFEQIGIASDQAIALALLVFSVRVVVSILGGLVLLFGGNEYRLKHAPST